MTVSDKSDADTDSDEGEDEEEEPLFERIDFRRVASVAASILVIAAAVPFVIYAFPGLVGAKSSFVVLSGSMEPTMSPGDVIVIEGVEGQNIEQGDVITYQPSGAERPTTHRVIEVTQENGEPAFRTKGDANEDPDGGVVRASEVEGRVPTVAGHPFVIPFVGHLIVFAGTQLGFTLLFAAPLIVFVGTEIKDLMSATRATPDDESEADSAAAASADDTAETTGDDWSPARSELPDGVESAIVPLDDAAGGADEVTADGDDEATSDEEAEADSAVTLTPAELSLGLFVLGAFVAYSLWVAYTTVTVWAMTVAGASATAFLMLGSLYAFGGGAADATADDEEATGEEATDDGAPEGADPDAIDDLPALDDLFGDVDTDPLPPPPKSVAEQLSRSTASRDVDELPPFEELFEDRVLADDPIVFEELSTAEEWAGGDDLRGTEAWSGDDDWAPTEFESQEVIVFGEGDADDDPEGAYDD